MSNYVKVYISLWGIHCIKNQDVEFLQNKSDVAIFKDYYKKENQRNFFKNIFVALYSSKRDWIVNVPV